MTTTPQAGAAGSAPEAHQAHQAYGADWLAVAAFAAYAGGDLEQGSAAWARLSESQRVRWRRAVIRLRPLFALDRETFPGQPEGAQQ